MHPVWAQRRKEVLSDCLVSPDVFTQMVERLGEFVIPYQHALETAASGCHVHRYLQGLLSPLARKNAEKIATFVHVVRQVIPLTFRTRFRIAEAIFDEPPAEQGGEAIYRRCHALHPTR